MASVWIDLTVVTRGVKEALSLFKVQGEGIALLLSISLVGAIEVLQGRHWG